MAGTASKGRKAISRVPVWALQSWAWFPHPKDTGNPPRAPEVGHAVASFIFYVYTLFFFP